MRRILFIIALVAGCATDESPNTHETEIEQPLVGYCKAIGFAEAFEGSWEDTTMRRCCHAYWIAGQLAKHCVSCGTAGWMCTGSIN